MTATAHTTIATVTASWPDWAQHLALLMGKVGAYEIIYRNPDLRGFLEPRNPDFAAWALDRDVTESALADDRKETAYGLPEGSGTYVRCTECGTKILDPVIRIDRGGV